MSFLIRKSTVATSSPLMLGIDSLNMRDEPVRLPEKKPNHIQNVNPHIRKNELLELAQKRLIIENGKTGTEVHARPERLPDDARVQRTLHFAKWTLPTPVFMNKQRNVRFAADL